MLRCTLGHAHTDGDEHFHFETWEEVHQWIDDLGYGDIRDSDGDVIVALARPGEYMVDEPDTMRATYISRHDWDDGVRENEDDYSRTYTLDTPHQLHTYTRGPVSQTVVDEAIASILSTYQEGA